MTINFIGYGIIQLSNEVINIVCVVLIWNDCVILILQPKCQQYWPEAVNGSCTYGNISVTLIQEEVLAEYTIRTLAVKMVREHYNSKSNSKIIPCSRLRLVLRLNLSTLKFNIFTLQSGQIMVCPNIPRHFCHFRRGLINITNVNVVVPLLFTAGTTCGHLCMYYMTCILCVVLG